MGIEKAAYTGEEEVFLAMGTVRTEARTKDVRGIKDILLRHGLEADARGEGKIGQSPRKEYFVWSLKYVLQFATSCCMKYCSSVTPRGSNQRRPPGRGQGAGCLLLAWAGPGRGGDLPCGLQSGEENGDLRGHRGVLTWLHHRPDLEPQPVSPDIHTLSKSNGRHGIRISCSTEDAAVETWVAGRLMGSRVPTA